MGIRVGNAQADAEQVVDVPVLSGRDIARSDTTTGRKVMLVNQTFVRRYLAGQEPIGAFVRTGEEPGYPQAVYDMSAPSVTRTMPICARTSHPPRTHRSRSIRARARA